MIRRIARVCALAVQVTGVGVLAYAGFLLAAFVGWAVIGVGLCLVGYAFEREVG